LATRRKILFFHWLSRGEDPKIHEEKTWAGNCQAWRGEFELLVTHGDRDFDVDSGRCQYP